MVKFQFPTNPVESLRLLIQPYVRHRLLINVLSEFFATFLLILFGTGAIAQATLSTKFDGQVQLNLAWGVLFTLCIYATFHTSGGHMNPAVSLAMTSMGKLPALHFLAYSAAQTFGAFLGAGLSYHVYRNQINRIQLDYTRTIFCSSPVSGVGHYTAFVDQIVGTALLLFAICALTDARNGVPTWMQPPGIGAALFLIGSSFGLNVGSPVNPARDFGSRLFALFILGGTAFSYHGYYFWIPLLAPFVGALVGTWLYQLFIGVHLPDPTTVVATVAEIQGVDENVMEAAPGAIEDPTTLKNVMPIVLPMEMPQTAKTMPLTNMGPTSTMKSPTRNMGMGPGTQQIVPPTTKMSSPSIDPRLYNSAKK